MIKKFKDWRKRSSKVARVNVYSAVLIVIAAILLTLGFIFPIMVNVILGLMIFGTVGFCIWLMVYMSVM